LGVQKYNFMSLINPIVVGVTGHRPKDLGGYGNTVFTSLYQTANLFFSEYYTKEKVSKVIVGMALGWDQAAALAAIDNGIPVSAYIPFKGQERRWPKSSQEFYNNLLSKCSEVKIISTGGYSPEKMLIRNRAIVDDCNELIALYNGKESGGTFQCLNYAKSLRTKIILNLYAEYDKIYHENLITIVK